MSAADRQPAAQRWRQWLSQWDDGLASAALLLMMLVSLVEMAMRPLMGQGVENASILVQHLGLVLAMFGALAAERHGHLSTLGGVGPGFSMAGAMENYEPFAAPAKVIFILCMLMGRLEFYALFAILFPRFWRR